jgi:glycine/D-amino acid oxidase-like deaminating enzyme
MTIPDGDVMDEIECVVVGAGVVGLAAARALALAGFELLVLERAYTIALQPGYVGSGPRSAGPPSLPRSSSCRGPRCPWRTGPGKFVWDRIAGAYHRLAARRRGSAESLFRRQLTEEAAMPAQAP